MLRKCLFEKYREICLLENEELGIHINGEVVIEPGRLIKIRFLSAKEIKNKKIEYLVCYFPDDTGILYNLEYNGQKICSNGINTYEFVSSYGLFKNLSNETTDIFKKIKTIRVYSRQFSDIRLAENEEISLDYKSQNFCISNYKRVSTGKNIKTEEYINYIEIKYTKEISFNEVINTTSIITKMIALWIDNPVNIDAITIVKNKVSKSGVNYKSESYIYLPLSRYDSYSQTREINNRGQIKYWKDNIGINFDNWIKIFDELGDPLIIYYNSLYSDTFVDQKLLNLTSLVENLNKYLTHTFKKKMDLKKRLIQCLEIVNPSLKYNEDILNDIAERIKNQRHVVAHSDKNYKNQLDKELFKLNNILNLAIQGVLFNCIFNDEKELDKMINSRKNSYLLPYEET